MSEGPTRGAAARYVPLLVLVAALSILTCSRAALAAHPNSYYRKILYNDFVILGPREDSAGVARAKDAVDAMRRIAESHSRFISRGDESGTHERERQLWDAAGVRPTGERLVIAGASMGNTLRIASETAGRHAMADLLTSGRIRGFTLWPTDRPGKEPTDTPR